MSPWTARQGEQHGQHPCSCHQTRVGGGAAHRAPIGPPTCSGATSPRPVRTSGGGAYFTYVATWSGVVYVAFVVNVFSRAIVGWSAATSKRAKLVLDVLDMALWRRDRAGTPSGPGLVHHSDAGSRHTSFAFTAHVLDAGIDASIDTVGDALNNALMESRSASTKRN